MTGYILYRCIECNNEIVSVAVDGKSCDKCKGYMSPVRKATGREFTSSIKESIKGKGFDVCVIDEFQPTAMKLEYLDRLTRLHGNLATVNNGHKNTLERINAVCDSIEKDLGLQDGDEDITESEKEAIRSSYEAKHLNGGIIIKPGVSGVGKVNG
ncbi:MAG: hypothetical protein ACQEXQ_16415 [Bacillota bacterium]